MANNPRGPRRNSSDLPPPVSDESERAKQTSEIKKPSFWISVIALLVVGGYTYFAHEQVSETQTANSIAKKALAEANKPYVMFAGIFPNHTKDANGEHLRVGFTLTNFGNTPASYVRFNSCDPIIFDGVAAPSLHCTVTEKPSEFSEIGPKQALSIFGPVIKEADLEATTVDKKSVYVLGYVTYQDSVDFDRFGNPEQRETRFCQRLIEGVLKNISPANNAVAATSPWPPTTTGAIPSAIPDLPIDKKIIGQYCPAFSCLDASCRPLQ
jgi:hypothetical protein